MCKLHARFIIIILSIITLTELSAWAVDESKVVSSAEKVAKRWVELLPKTGSNAVCLKSAGDGKYKHYWFVRQFKHVEVSYDVKKTGSIISPYILTISIWSSYMDNDQSPRANGYRESESSDVMLGFNSEEEALSHTSIDDFKKRDPKIIEFPYCVGTFEIFVCYSYREKLWEYKGWEGKRKRYIGDEESPIYSFTPFEEGVFGGNVQKIDGITCDCIRKLEYYFSNVLKDMPID